MKDGLYLVKDREGVLNAAILSTTNFPAFGLFYRTWRVLDDPNKEEFEFDDFEAIREIEE